MKTLNELLYQVELLNELSGDKTAALTAIIQRPATIIITPMGVAC